VKSRGRPGDADFPAPRRLLFGVDDLRLVRRVTAQWATRVGLSASRTDDFVIAVQEIAANAVRYGSPGARLLLRVTGGAAAAEIHDDGCWPPSPGAIPAIGRRGGMGLALARLVCDEVDIRTGNGGTTVLLRMSP
jgi:anti-sigma regulatory factor (Ser/Thr protein kinase)